jgi:hypothetical protein
MLHISTFAEAAHFPSFLFGRRWFFVALMGPSLAANSEFFSSAVFFAVSPTFSPVSNASPLASVAVEILD